MKKSAFYFFILLSLFLAAGTSPAGTENTQILVSNMQGSPTLVRNGQTLPVSMGMACQKNDILKTNENCTVDVSMSGLAGCRLLASSEGTIAESDPKNMQIKINNGNAVLNLKKLPEGTAFKVETPTAIAAVRGTQFWGRVDLGQSNNPVTTFAVREGTVEIFTKATGLNLMIQKGQALDIPKDPSITLSLRTALAQELQAMEQADSIKTSA